MVKQSLEKTINGSISSCLLQIDVATSKKATNKIGHMGFQWDIPASIGKIRSGTDKKGQTCKNVDFVVHSMTYQMSEKNAAFKNMLIETVT